MCRQIARGGINHFRYHVADRRSHWLSVTLNERNDGAEIVAHGSLQKNRLPLSGRAPIGIVKFRRRNLRGNLVSAESIDPAAFSCSKKLRERIVLYGTAGQHNTQHLGCLAFEQEDSKHAALVV